jgi:hypothetical protein
MRGRRTADLTDLRTGEEVTQASDFHTQVGGQPAAWSPPPVLPPALRNGAIWTDEMVARAGLPMYDVPFVSVGGGMGSFVTVDYLRVAGGVPASDIRVLSNLPFPWKTYEYLARMSQIPRHDRIRSDAASRPDNLWGFPSYALQEAVREKTLRPLLQVLVEPVLAHFYTPKLGNVLDGIEREAHRIRYWDMLVHSEVHLVRRRVGGGYFTLVAPYLNRPDGPALPDGAPIVFRSRDVHIAVGYAGLRFLPDLQRFRTEHNDYHHVVNAYENHEHVYEALRVRPGRVLVRGGGIVASRVLERLMLDRAKYGLGTEIVHLLRTHIDSSHGPHMWARRKGHGGFAYQGFNYPKSVWGGQLRARMDKLQGQERAAVYDEIGGTTTAWRWHWQRQLRTARTQGWYRTQPGTIDELRLDGNMVVATLDTPQGRQDFHADYVIDCTGLEGDVAEHRVLGDLLKNGGARRNPLGRLDVERSFELIGGGSGEGRIYVTGAASYGGYFAGVDTFLGLQIAAQEVVDDVAARGYCRRMGPVSSTVGWLKWFASRQI